MNNQNNEPVFQYGWLSTQGVVVLRWIVSTLFWIFARLEVQGLENIPVSGGFILSPNHLSRLDAPLIYTLVKSRKFTGFVADTYRHNLFFHAIVRSIDVIWVHRGAIGPSTLKHALKALCNGSVMCIAPEGTRSKTGTLLAGRPGAAFLAVAAGVLIVPVALDNPEQVFPSLLRLKRQKVTVTFGAPIIFTSPENRFPSSPVLGAYTTEIMCQIAALLPVNRRGVYADHPRLKELLGTTAGWGGNAPPN